jgi:hypothetical protein
MEPLAAGRALKKLDFRERFQNGKHKTGTAPRPKFMCFLWLREPGAVPLLPTLNTAKWEAILEQPRLVPYSLPSPTFLMNRDLALADWLDELAIYGTPRRFQDAETAYHLSQMIQHRYIVALALAHTPIGLRALGAS